MTVDELKRVIESQFSEVPHPGDDNLMCHHAHYKHCDEHQQAEKTFENKTWKTMLPEFLEASIDQLNFLSPEAFRYFFPPYLVHALDTPNGMFWLSVIIHLTGKPDATRRQFESFTPAEVKLLISYLEFSNLHFTPAGSEKVMKKRFAFWQTLLE